MQAWPCIAAKRAVKERTITQIGGLRNAMLTVIISL